MEDSYDVSVRAPSAASAHTKSPSLEKSSSSLELFHSVRVQAHPCFITLLGQTMQREVVSFLTFREILAFASTCKKFRALVIDPYVSINPPKKLQTGYMYWSQKSHWDINESILYQMFDSGKKVQTLLVLDPMRLETFHVESATWYYSYFDGEIIVWIIKPDTDTLENIGRLKSAPNVAVVSGFEDWVVSVSESGLCLSSRNHKQELDFIPTIDSYAKVTPWTHGKVTSVHWVSAGKHIIAANSAQLTVLDLQLSVLATVQFAEGLHFVHVEKTSDSMVVAYHGSTISVYNYGQSFAVPVYEMQASDVVAVHYIRVDADESRGEYVITWTANKEVYVSGYKRVFLKNVEGFELSENYLSLWVPQDMLFYVYYFAPAEIRRARKVVVSGGSDIQLVPMQQKLVKLETVQTGLQIELCKYHTPLVAYCSQTVAVRTVTSVRRFGLVVLVKGLTFGGKECLLVIPTFVPVTKERLKQMTRIDALETAPSFEGSQSS